MARKPTKVSLLARQRNLIEGRATKGLTQKQLAKELAVSQADLSRFLHASPQQVKRSSRLQNVYSKSTRPQLREELSVPKIRRYETDSAKLRKQSKDLTLIRKYPDTVSTGADIVALDTKHSSTARTLQWNEGTQKRFGTTSWKQIREMRLRGQIDDDDWEYVTDLFDEIYGEA